MKPAQHSVILLKLIEKLRDHGSWCGETHIQKGGYLLKSLCLIPLQFDFVLYKYGPFSFELMDHLSGMRAERLIRLVPQAYPYRPSIEEGDNSSVLMEMYPKTGNKYLGEVNFVADVIGSKGVTELEKLATAKFVSDELGPQESEEERAKLLTEYKPHIESEEALESVRHMDLISNKWKNCRSES